MESGNGAVGSFLCSARGTRKSFEEVLNSVRSPNSLVTPPWMEHLDGVNGCNYLQLFHSHGVSGLVETGGSRPELSRKPVKRPSLTRAQRSVGVARPTSTGQGLPEARTKHGRWLGDMAVVLKAEQNHAKSLSETIDSQVDLLLQSEILSH